MKINTYKLITNNSVVDFINLDLLTLVIFYTQ